MTEESVRPKRTYLVVYETSDGTTLTREIDCEAHRHDGTFLYFAVPKRTVESGKMVWLYTVAMPISRVLSVSLVRDESDHEQAVGDELMEAAVR